MQYSLRSDQLRHAVDAPSRHRPLVRRRERPLKEPNAADLARLHRGETKELLLARRYRLQRFLGRGGMAAVYQAYDEVFSRTVALKVLHEDLATRPQMQRRFLREARLCGRIRHKNVVDVLDYGETSTGIVYLSMELLSGEDLRAVIARRGRLPWRRTLRFMGDILAGLHAVHEAGVVHRDLKPSNCFATRVRGRQRIKLLDFGIATRSCSSSVRGETELALAETRQGQRNRVVGTPQYMSPEQARGDAVDRRSDIYAAGLLLAEMLTGQAAFEEATPAALMAAQIYEPAPSLSELGLTQRRVAPALEGIYAKCVSKVPGERYATALELIEALRAVPSRMVARHGTQWYPRPHAQS